MTMTTTWPTLLRPLAYVLALAPALLARAGDDWPQFRGPTQDGQAADAADLPTKWSESQNVKFKTKIPGEGWSSPVVLGKQVWLTTALNGGRSLHAIAIDRDGGQVIHDVEVFAVANPDRKNAYNSYASPTPVLEAGRAYVSFGTYGSACLDAATGQVLWKNQDLKIDHKEGPGSSPILYKGLYLLHCDGTDQQYVVALDKLTGKVVWRTDRTRTLKEKMPDYRKAYCVPTIATIDGKDQVLSMGAQRMYGYDVETGKELWYCDVPGYSTVPRPLWKDNVAYVCTGYDSAQLWAIRTDGAAGDVSRTHVLWKHRQGVSLKPSPLLIDGRIYMVADNGIARGLDAKTGQQFWQSRIPGTYSASPVYAAGLIYFANEQGATTVIRPGAEPVLVATNELADPKIMGSPAVSGKSLFLRTLGHLYRIETP